MIVSIFFKLLIYKMNFSKEASKLVTNKYFLYFMVFLAVANVLGYLVTNKTNAVIFFALIALLTYQFSKNMAVVLLVALIATNFLMSSKMIKEGLENQDATSLQKAADVDPQIGAAVPVIKNSKTNDDAKKQMDSPTITALDNSTDINNPDLNQQVSEGGAPEGFGDKVSNNKKQNNNGSSRLDYAATIEESYKHLDNILGSDSIQRLTQDTHNLMSKQQQLFETMNSMVPVLEGAQNMLQNLNMGKIGDALKKISPGLDMPGLPTPP